MKKTLLVLVAAILSSLILVAQEPATSGFCGTTENGADGSNLTWSYDASTTTLTISGTGEMQNFSWDSDLNCPATPWKAHTSSITEVIISDGVTSIGDRSFNAYPALSSVTIPSSVTSIGRLAFLDCTALTSVYISDLTAWCGIDFTNDCSNPFYAGASLYLNNELVDSLVIPDGISRLKDYLFCGGTFTSVTFPYGVTYIGDRTFQNCSALASVSFPASVTFIDDRAFESCSALASVSLPETIEHIGGDAFYGTAFYNNLPDGVVYYGPICHHYKGMMPENASVSIKEGTKYIAERAFSDCSSMISVTIPDGVTSIGLRAFMFCSSLTSVTIPSGVTTVGHSAFRDCSSLTTVNLPESVEYFGGDAFSGTPFYDNRPDGDVYFGKTYYRYKGTMPENTSVTIKEGTKYIGDHAFDNCSTLTSVTIPSSVTSIGVYAFTHCSALTTVTIPDGVTSIGKLAFSYCSALTSVNIPDGVTSIDDLTFGDCSALTSVTIPDGVTSIGRRAFNNCTALKKAYVNCAVPPILGTTAFPSTTNIFVHDFSYDAYKNHQEWSKYNIFKQELGRGTCGENLTWILYSDSTLTISGTGEMDHYGSESMPWSDYSSAIATVTISEGVTSIGYGAFYNCSNLTTINIPESVEYVGGNAFLDTPFYNNLPDGDVYFGRTYYKYKGSMPANTSISIKEGTKYIADCAIYNCSSLTSVTIPSSVTSIGGLVFGGCSAIAQLETPAQFLNAFEPKLPLTSLVINSGELTSVEWTYIEGLNRTLLSIDMTGTTNTEIAEKAFCNFNKLESFRFPANVTKIAASAFENCRHLTEVTIPAGVTEIGEAAFHGCYSVAKLTFAENSALKTIGDWAFYNNHELTNIAIPEGLTTIGKAAFYGCSYVENITLPASLERIGDNGFAQCNQIKSMTVNAPVPPEIAEKTFFKVNRNIDFKVPASALDAYAVHPLWREFVKKAPVDVEQTTDNATQIYTANGQLIISTEAKADYIICNTSGQILRQGTAQGSVSITDLPRGICLIRINGQTHKITL